MADVLELAFRRATRALFPVPGRVLVAVSGGGDSIALLHLTAGMARASRPELVVAHLDHALRRGSGADARFVVRRAEALELPAIALRRDVRALKRKDESLEEAARRVRRSFLLETAASVGASAIATGHTLEDQAETILMRLARGAGPTGLAAMAPAGPGPFIKPLLGLEREALRAWLRKRRISFREDPTNASLEFDRNRVRHLVVPALAKALNPAAARHLVEAAERLREDAAYLDRVAHEQFEAIATRRANVLAVSAQALASLPRPVAARVARIALLEAGCDPRRVSSRHVDAVVALALRGRDAALDLPGPVGSRRRGRLVEFRPCVFPEKS